MPLIDISIKHGRTLEDARARLELAVSDITARFSGLVKQVEWTSDRTAVKMQGPGFTIDMRVDSEHVHVSGDAPLLGKLLSSPLLSGLRNVIEDRFQKRLT